MLQIGFPARFARLPVHEGCAAGLNADVINTSGTGLMRGRLA